MIADILPGFQAAVNVALYCIIDIATDTDENLNAIWIKQLNCTLAHAACKNNLRAILI